MEETTTIVEQVEQSPSEGQIVQYDPDQPWALWPKPEVFEYPLHSLGVAPGEPESVDAHSLVLYGPDGAIGRCTERGLKELGWNTQFPSDFIGKLDLNLASMVINERINSVANKVFSVVVENGNFVNLAPGWRELLPHSDSAQTVYDELKRSFGEVEVNWHERDDTGAAVRFFTPVQQEITRKVGDILRMGIQLKHSYGETISLDLYSERLVCLNGMRNDRHEYQWRNRANADPQNQMEWIRENVARVISTFDNIIEKSRRLAEVKLHGNAKSVLREHARVYGLPIRLFPALCDAFDAEPGDTLWHIANAFTRIATHGGLNRAVAENVQLFVGQYISNFRLVNARLPLPIAESVGAELLDEQSDELVEVMS